MNFLEFGFRNAENVKKKIRILISKYLLQKKEADQPFPICLSRVGHRRDPIPAGRVIRPNLNRG